MNEVPEAGDKPSAGRRPITARESGFAQRLTALLLETPITPNQISVISIAFARRVGPCCSSLRSAMLQERVGSAGRVR